jgi:hypothetical protein
MKRTLAIAGLLAAGLVGVAPVLLTTAAPAQPVAQAAPGTPVDPTDSEKPPGEDDDEKSGMTCC